MDMAAYERYQVEARRDISELVSPAIEAAERARQFPRQVLEALADRGHFHARWQGESRWGDPMRALLLYYELGLVGAGGIALGLSLHTEAATAILRRTRPIVSGENLYERAVSGRTVACFAVTEEAAGADIEETATRATQTPEGWSVQGAKKYISLARTADVAVMLTRTASDGPAQHSFFVVPNGQNGYRVVEDFAKLGTWSVETTRLEVSAALSKEHLAGAVGQGLELMVLAATCERFATVAMSLGTLDLALQLVRSHLETRGRNVWGHEGARQRWADAAAMQRTWWHAARRCATEIVHRRATERDVAALKLVVAQGVERALSELAILAGAVGYTQELPLERFVRDSRLFRVGSGPEDVLRAVMWRASQRHDALNSWKTRRRF